MPTLTFTCDYCGQEFQRWPGQVRQFNYCCAEHYWADKKRRFAEGHYIPHNFIPAEALIAELQSLAQKLGRSPIPRDMQESGRYSPLVYYRRFRTWDKALAIASLIPATVEEIRQDYPEAIPQNITAEEALAELKRVAQLLNHTPTDVEFREHGHLSTAPYWRIFGSWVAACETAGLEPHTTAEGGLAKVKRQPYTRNDGRQINFRGTYELRMVRVLDSLKLDWQSHGEIKPIPYMFENGTEHSYHPDFWVPSWRTYMDTKGWFRPEDRHKIQRVRSCNPDLHLVIVSKPLLEMYERLSSANISAESVPTQLCLW